MDEGLLTQLMVVTLIFQLVGSAWADLVRRAAASGHKVLAMYPFIPRTAASPGQYPCSQWHVYVLLTGEELHEVWFTDHCGCHTTLLALLWGLLPCCFDSFGPD